MTQGATHSNAHPEINRKQSHPTAMKSTAGSKLEARTEAGGTTQTAGKDSHMIRARIPIDKYATIEAKLARVR